MKKSAKYNWLPVTLHVLAWLVLVILPQILINRYWGNHKFIAWEFYVNAIGYGIIFYINYLWLVPQFYFKNKKIIYLGLAIGVIAGFYFILSAVNQLMHDPERERQMAEFFEKFAQEKEFTRPPMRLIRTYEYSLVSIIITGFSVGLRTIEKHSATEKRQKELEKEKLHSELAFLKNQISPHFFFNTLNNIYSLIEVNTSDAQEAVMKLSRMMRYLLYESEHGKTPLSHEINFMNHYIDLMRLRLSPKVDLTVGLPENETKLDIPPLLFIPFIENAFKHGISYRKRSFIYIALKIENEKLRFTCRNSQGSGNLDKNHPGIGLDNVKKRLSLLFPQKYKLYIRQSETEFDVFLEIDLTSEIK